MKPCFYRYEKENLTKPRRNHMSEKQTILLVDDDQAILDGTQLRLRACGYETLNAIDGVQGVATAIKTQPDAIVMDVRMPRMDGLAALTELQENEETKEIPVVMLSASLRDQQRALDAGARFFITKPYEGKNLVRAIESAIGEIRQPPQLVNVGKATANSQ